MGHTSFSEDGDRMEEFREERRKATGFFTTSFYYEFRSMFIPFTKFCRRMRITPNMITVLSMALAAVSGILFATDHLAVGVLFGLAMSFADIMDGQLAKSYGMSSSFGGILDSSIDRVNEFFVFAGFGARYLALGRPWMGLVCAVAFLGSVMTSYVKARAEADGFTCRVGKLQRPERLSVVGIGAFMACWNIDIGLDAAMVFLAVGTVWTTLLRLRHVYIQARERDAAEAAEA